MYTVHQYSLYSEKVLTDTDASPLLKVMPACDFTLQNLLRQYQYQE